MRSAQLSPGDGGDACTPPRAPQQSKRESKSKRPWWQLLKPSNSSSRMTETLEGPSAGEGVAWSGQHKPSSVRRPGERVEHTTNVPIGNEQSVHYQAMDTYYPFPLLGGVEAPVSWFPLRPGSLFSLSKGHSEAWFYTATQCKYLKSPGFVVRWLEWQLSASSCSVYCRKTNRCGNY